MKVPQTLAEFREFDKNPDPLVQAKLHYQDAEASEYEFEAPLAQAAALIALCERMDKLIGLLQNVVTDKDHDASIRVTANAYTYNGERY